MAENYNYYSNLNKTTESYLIKKLSVLEINEVFSKMQKHYEEEIGKLRSIVYKNNVAEGEIKIGPLSYKNHSVFYNSSRLENLTPQEVKLLKLFMTRPDEFISYNSIKEALTVSEYTTTANMQKLVSKLRRNFNKKNKKIEIKPINQTGYMFITKNLR